MAYIANRPVRFDRDYKVGEVIPDTVIAPSMTRKLVEMSRILHVDLPQGSPQDGAYSAQGGDSGADSINTQPNGESPQSGAESAIEEGEFVCDVCGRAFKSQNALAAHSRSHKE